MDPTNDDVIRDVPQMDYRYLKRGMFVVLAGRRHVGKSTTQRRIAFELARSGQIDLAIGFNPSEYSDPEPHMRTFCPPHLVFTRWNEGLVKAIMKFQEEGTSLGRRQHIAIFLDDILSERAASATGKGHVQIKNSAVFQELATRARHIGITVVACVHRLNSLAKIIVENIDVLYAHHCASEDEHQALWAHSFKAIIPNYDEYLAVARSCTTNKGSMVALIRNINTKHPCLFASRSIKRSDPIPDTFTCGLPIYWKLDYHYMPRARAPVEPTVALSCTDDELACLGINVAALKLEDADGGSDEEQADERRRRRARASTQVREVAPLGKQRFRVNVLPDDDE